jgi:DNA polymerase III alpha subunit
VKTSKRGNRFISIAFEDLEGSCSAVVLRDIERFEKVLKQDSVVFLQGTVDTARDQASIRIKNVIALAEAPHRLPTCLVVTIPEGVGTEEELGKLRRILEKHPGNSTVYMNVSAGDTGRIEVRLPRAITVEVGKRLLTKIEALLGSEHVTYSALGMRV